MPRSFVFGFHAVTGRLRAAPGTLVEIYLDATRDDARTKALVKLAADKGVRVMQVEVARIDGLGGGVRHQGVAASVETTSAAAKSLDDLLDGIGGPSLLLVLDGVTDPHNLGACLRVADGAGVHAVIAPKDRACGINATVSKVASGAAEVIPYFMVTNLARTLEELKERDIWIIGTMDDAAEGLYEADFPASSAWVFGAEGQGMRRLTRERCDLQVRIPMHGTVESLNVSVAVGVCLFEARRRRGAA